ncbi:MAG: stage III sporulation protein AE [Bacillota bacterium]|nr:stage III sporulation protein AE [Bacillota bacterium]MDD3298926.1 stage III sporulation protein AE [Bacillota bacterium]MDD3850524.1 stage III sporulation protein AE [Bacillota bacterium]MDD4707654.1 stage III sporulation protein AE [Bacillota bacterium]
MIKSTVSLLLTAAFVVLPSVCAGAATENESPMGGLIEEQVENLNLGDVQGVLDSLNREVQGYMPAINAVDLVKGLVRGDVGLSPAEVLSGMGRYLFAQVLANINLLAKLVVLSIVYAILCNIQDSFGNGTVSELARITCMLVLTAIAVQSFWAALKIGSSTIDSMVVFMQVFLPTLLALLAVMGGITSMALLQPVLAVSIGFFSTVFKDFLLPVIFFSAILAIVNNISDKFHLSRLASLLKQGCVVLIGLVLTVFIGIMTIQGVTAATVDGVSIRTAKFAADNFVPIVGGFFSDAVDTIVGCSLLIKNAVGAFGLIALFTIIAFPVLKIISLVVIYKVCAAVIEPVAEGQLVRCLNEMAGSLLLLFATVASVALMFFISVTIIIGAGNAALMMR